MEKYKLLKKTLRVINSCTDAEQLKVALTYAFLAAQRGDFGINCERALAEVVTVKAAELRSNLLNHPQSHLQTRLPLGAFPRNQGPLIHPSL